MLGSKLISGWPDTSTLCAEGGPVTGLRRSSDLQVFFVQNVHKYTE